MHLQAALCVLGLCLVFIVHPANAADSNAVDSEPVTPEIYMPQKYKGCYALKTNFLTYSNMLNSVVTPVGCISHCAIRGYKYAALENGDLCWCGANYRADDVAPLADSECQNAICQQTPTSTAYYCGGLQKVMVYFVG